MEAIISTFHIDWKIIIAQIVNFGVVFVVLYIYALKPLSKLMAERSDKIKKGVDDAKKSDELLKQAAKEYEQNTIKLRQLSIDAQKELKKDLEKIKAEHTEKMKADNDEWTKKRIEQMEIDKRTIVESVKNDIVNIAMIAAEKVIKDKQNLNS